MRSLGNSLFTESYAHLKLCMKEIFVSQDLLFSHFPEGENESSSLTLSQFQAIQHPRLPVGLCHQAEPNRCT
jgi:hypothetical protein